MKRSNLLWSLLLTMALFFNGSLSQTAFANYMDQAYEEEMFCDEEQEQPCNRSLWIGGGVLGLATIGAIACAIIKHRNHHKGCHQNRCCNEVPDNGGGGAGGALTATFTVTFTTPLPSQNAQLIVTLNNPDGVKTVIGGASSSSPGQTLTFTSSSEVARGEYTAYLTFPKATRPFELNATLNVVTTGEFGSTSNTYTFPPVTRNSTPFSISTYVSELNFIIL